MAHRDLKVLDAAERAADMLDALIKEKGPGGLLHVNQMRDAIQSIAANIGEAFGRPAGKDRNRVLGISRAETEEAIRHVNANYRTGRTTRKEHWPLHDLLVVIIKMLNGHIYRR